MHRWLLPIIALVWPAFAIAQTEQENKDDDELVAETEEEPERKSDFVDTRINFTFTNENVLAGVDEIGVPGSRLGQPGELGTLFFDNYDTRFSGFETLSHAVLYKKYSQDHLEVEAALVIRINDIAGDEIKFSDAGSYIRVAHWTDPTRQSPERWSLTAFPTSSDRFRLGYSYRLSWGGTDELRRVKTPVPGLKVQWENDRLYAFVGAKSVVLVDKEIQEERSVVSYLAGAGADLTDMFRVEVNGGYFDRGTNQQQDVLGEHVFLYGVSAQVAIQQGIPVGSSVDYKLYRNDLEGVRTYVRQKPEYPGGTAWMVAAEATYLGQTLKDPSSPGSTTVQNALAGDVNFRMKHNYTRIRFDAQMRDVAYVLHSQPSLPSYVDFSDEYDITPNYFAAVGVDQHFPGLGLTTGVVVGLELPATIKSPKPIVEIDLVSEGESVYVVRAEGDYTILPPGEKAVAMFATKATARLDFGDNQFASILDVYYSRDPNRTRLRRDGPDDLFKYKFEGFNQLGFNLTLQARF